MAGLSYAGTEMEEKESLVARYELLAELGWALFAQEDYVLAQKALEDTTVLEDQLYAFEEEDNTQYRLALPHCYLAQIYEQQQKNEKAIQEWEDCLRFLKQDWASQDWHTTAQERIQTLEEE